jgi:hypothetical protein
MKSEILMRMKVEFKTQAKEFGAHFWCCWKDLND